MTLRIKKLPLRWARLSPFQRFIVVARLGLLALAGGCTLVHSGPDGGTVRVERCEVIVDDVLGDVPTRPTGPRARALDGYGVTCDVWTW